MTSKLIKPKLNHQIRAHEVRVVEPNRGVISHGEAMAEAYEMGVDLIEISPNAVPPVCVLQDWGKWKYEQSKKEKAAKQTVLETKQIQIRPVTEQHDMEFKSRQVRGFLEEGHKVRLVVRLRGRELAHEAEAQNALDKLIELCECTVEQRSSLEGKQIVALVSKRVAVKGDKKP